MLQLLIVRNDSYRENDNIIQNINGYHVCDMDNYCPMTIIL